MELVTVQGSMQLEAATAQAWGRLVAEARAATGITPVLSSPAGAWRSEELVVDMWRDPAKYGASQGVAKPRSLGGGGSVHQNGRCVDINNWRAFGDLVVSRGFWRSRRLDDLAAAQGFHPDPRYPNEPWHYQHTGTSVAGDIEEDDMPTIQEIHDDTVSILRSAEFGKPAVAQAILTARVSSDTGTLAQTVRDARVIARRTELAVQALTATIAAGAGVSEADLTRIIDAAVSKAVAENVPSPVEIAQAVADAIPDTDPAKVAEAVAPLLTVVAA